VSRAWPIGLALGLVAGAAAPALAGPSCTGAHRIDETFESGARWQLCFEVRTREAVVYREIHYTPPGGAERKVLEEVSLAQIHVPYDDNGARFHDVTDYGAGGGNLDDLTSAECPGGVLLQDGAKNVLCKKVARRGSAYDALLDRAQGWQLELFSVSHIGAYNYIPTYRFLDDGTIEVAMGATGQLQRFEYGDPSATDIGWPLNASGSRIGISHIHNYYFRMDFDLGGTADDDVVEQIDVATDGAGATRTLSVTPFTSEGAADVAPSSLRSWRVRDGSLQNAHGHPVSYELVPLESGHRDEGPAYEPFTHDDFYVTKYSACEQYASHNNQLLGCGDDLQDFTDGESLAGEDVVVWYGLTFHHIPRDEDESRMHAHWNGFRLEPRDWSDATPLSVDAHECPPGSLDFETLALESHPVQDAGGSALATHAGSTLQLTGNTWKRSVDTWTVTPDSVLELEFASAREGEVHAIGLDENDDVDDAPRHFQLAGSQAWTAGGGIAVSPPYAGAGGFESFSIPVGQWFTGSGLRLVFANDDDSGGEANAGGRFRCVRLFEPGLPPSWTDPGPQADAEGDAVSLLLAASDPEGQPVTYGAAGLPPGLGIDPATGEISGTLDYASAGVHAVVATADDGVDGPSEQPFTWTVANTNRSPVWSDPGPQADAEGDPVSLLLAAPDPDGDSVTYTAVGLPPGLAVESGTGEVHGTLDYASAGVYSVVATASDGSAPVEQPFAWTVANTNREPVWTDPGPQLFGEGDAVSFLLVAVDPDGDGVTYGVVGLPPGLALEPGTGQVSGALGYASAGLWSVMATASDGSAPADQPFTIEIAEAPRPPVEIPSLPGATLPALAALLVGAASRRLGRR